MSNEKETQHLNVLQNAGLLSSTTDIEETKIVAFDPSDCREVQVAAGLSNDILARVAPYRLIASGQLKLDNCDYTNNFTTLKFADKGKAVSSVSFGQLRRTGTLGATEPQPLIDVALKITFVPNDPRINTSLEAERKIYRQVVNRMVMQRQTPHVALYYGELRCDTFKSALRRLVEQNVPHALALQDRIDENEYYLKKVQRRPYARFNY